MRRGDPASGNGVLRPTGEELVGSADASAIDPIAISGVWMFGAWGTGALIAVLAKLVADIAVSAAPLGMTGLLLLAVWIPITGWLFNREGRPWMPLAVIWLAVVVLGVVAAVAR